MNFNKSDLINSIKFYKYLKEDELDHLFKIYHDIDMSDDIKSTIKKLEKLDHPYYLLNKLNNSYNIHKIRGGADYNELREYPEESEDLQENPNSINSDDLQESSNMANQNNIKESSNMANQNNIKESPNMANQNNLVNNTRPINESVKIPREPIFVPRQTIFPQQDIHMQTPIIRPQYNLIDTTKLIKNTQTPDSEIFNHVFSNSTPFEDQYK